MARSLHGDATGHESPPMMAYLNNTYFCTHPLYSSISEYVGSNEKTKTNDDFITITHNDKVVFMVECEGIAPRLIKDEIYVNRSSLKNMNELINGMMEQRETGIIFKVYRVLSIFSRYFVFTHNLVV